MTKGNADLALVLSGGGARAAYQVGFLRVLARDFPDVVPGILTGVSAGGINAAYLAARPDPFDRKVEALADIWRALRIDSVFRVDLRDLASRSVRWGGRLLSGGKYPVPPARSLVDTEPLHELLQGLLQAERGDIKGIAQNLEAGWAARGRADRLELHDGPVGDVGSDARELPHRHMGAAAAQERRVHASRRTCDGVVRLTVLLSGHRS
jgi:predicted acylesterase/phospholipase RssA